MKHYKIYFWNDHFYIADSSVTALIKMLKRIDPNLKAARGKEGKGHLIYFDSAVGDHATFKNSIQKFIEDKKYEYHQFQLFGIKHSGALGPNVESLNHLIPFDKFNLS